MALPFLYPLRICLPLPQSSLLLKEVKDNFDLDLELVLHRLGGLRRQQWHEYNKLTVYIQPLSKASLQASGDNLVPLHTRVYDFLDSEAEVMLILGDSGAGKSTFNLHLDYKLWDTYKPGDPISLFIDLKAIKNPDDDMIQQQLEDLGKFSPRHIAELKRSRKFILICDGYDERRDWSNLHTNNSFNNPSQWGAKMIITCRTQYLQSSQNYRSYFEPKQEASRTQRLSPASNLFEEAVIVPFNEHQIEEYIKQYTTIPGIQDSAINDVSWTAEQYLDRLSTVINLKELVKNPFILQMMLETLPRLSLLKTQITRAELYDEFVQLHFENERERLIEQRSRGRMEPECRAEFDQFEGDDLINLGIDFSKRLAGSIFKEQNGVNSVEFSAATNKNPWKTEFFGSDTRVKLLRESSQLVCRANVQQESRRMVHNRNRKTSKRNLYGFSQKGLKGEQSVIHFLAERVQQDSEFKDQLNTILRSWTKPPETYQAAINASRILSRSGVDFDNDNYVMEIPIMNPDYLNIGEEVDTFPFGTIHMGTYRDEPVCIRKVDEKITGTPLDSIMGNIHLGEFCGVSANVLRIHGICQGRMIVTETTTHGPLSEFTIANTLQKVTLARRIASTVVYLHECGVIHEDIRAANVLIDKSQNGEDNLEPKITGFEMCRRKGEMEEELPEIKSGYCKGWPPEKIANFGSSSSSDVYSFGALMYEISTGKEPANGDLIEMEGKRISAEYTKLMERCLSRYFNVRPTMEEVEQELLSIEMSL
ncbi:hypothetical protein EC968_008905 [Mortierella alpina]|nr:hypothetical protein EC968_008905 [Mortierella alpina]